MPINRRTFLQTTAAGVVLAAQPSLDLFNAAIILPPNASARVKAYSALFTEEAGKRCGAAWQPGKGSSRIRLIFKHHQAGEGFDVSVVHSEIRINGHSERGLFYGLGYLLRNIEFAPQHAFLPQERARISSAPAYPLRGHQLGYRPKTNSYDGWDVAQWHQYIKDLAVFGINAIEILPPHTDDQATSSLFPLRPEQMMVEVSRLADQYGMDVWMWYPAMGDYSHPDGVAASLKEWAAIFEKLPRLDAVFTPGGDPGDTEPATLLALLKQQKQNLRRYHSNAKMWVSPQSFDAAQLLQFFDTANKAEWLDGVVFGPQCRVSLAELREKLRRDLPIRLYPDITHSLQCQFPVPDWKREFAFTEGRECINPRPQSFSAIARQYLPYTIGFISYSEGCNDDVNKALWSSAAWNRKFDVDACLLEYSRYFINAPQARTFAAGLQQLEQTWIDPTRSADSTLALFQTLEKSASPATARNWRFQQALYRSYYDAYSYRRSSGYVNVALRDRVLVLGKDLFESIRMQLDVEHYHAESIERGANLDTLDADLFGPPQNITVGPGSYYDDLGDPHNRPHLLEEHLSEPDPEFRGSVLIGFLYPDSLGRNYPFVWKRWGETLFDTALQLRYTGLDRKATYKLRVVYSGDAHDIKVHLSANDIQIHPLIKKPWPPKPLDFVVPKEVTRSGTATFSWTRELGLGGGGRGCQISEVWLIRQ